MGNLLGIVYLNGEKHVGKDHVAQKLLDAPFGRINIQTYSLASPMKKILAEMHEISVEELEKRKKEFRVQMVALAEGMKSLDPFIFVKQVAALHFNKPNTILVITDGRYDCEAIFLKNIWNKVETLSVKIHKDHFKKYRSSDCGYNLSPMFVDFHHVNDFDGGDRHHSFVEELVTRIEREFL